MSDDSRRWKTLSSRLLVDRWWMRLREDRVLLPTGVEIEEFHVAEHPDWALAIPLREDGHVVMVEQYRYGIDQVTLEFPAGVVQEGEDPGHAAKRELLEETGYAATSLVRLGSLSIEPNRNTNYGHLYFASEVQQANEPQPDATEDLSVRLVQASALLDLLDAGHIVHGMHAAALLLAFQKGLMPAG